MVKKKTKESQYQVLVSHLEEKGATELGIAVNYEWNDDPRRFLFMLSRYKFAAKMLTGKSSVLEVGCGDAFGVRMLLQEVDNVCAIDFDPIFISDAKKRMDSSWSFDCRVHDILNGPMDERYDAAISLDVLEHISSEDEDQYMLNVLDSINDNGIFIIGTPTIQSQEYASITSKAGHVNCKDEKELRNLVSKFFRNIFIFSMNDEVVHTGFHPMAHYLFAIGVGKK